MSLTDLRGAAVTGATRPALDAYERALAASLAWRADDGDALATASSAAPQFVMANALRAWQLVGGRDPRRIELARPLVVSSLALPSNDRERLHLAALSHALADDFEGAKARLGRALRREPRDVVALHAALGLDHVTGDAVAMRRRTTRVLPAWSREDPVWHAVLAMHAFALCETGDYARAEESALAALALNPLDARACHAMAHVFEMTDRPGAGVRWMSEHADAWASATTVVTHGWWHVALFHLSLHQPERALAAYDAHVRSVRSEEVSDLIDASALLWRIALSGSHVGERWSELAESWGARIDDRYCSFSDVHAMLAFVGADDRERTRRLEAVLVDSARRDSRHGRTTRQLGLPACRALMAYGRGDDALAIRLLAGLPPIAHRLGGSHAQRDVLHLTLQHAVERARRPARRRLPALARRLAAPI